eukprot:3658993-Rhodomonas_salina.1
MRIGPGAGRGGKWEQTDGCAIVIFNRLRLRLELGVSNSGPTRTEKDVLQKSHMKIARMGAAGYWEGSGPCGGELHQTAGCQILKFCGDGTFGFESSSDPKIQHLSFAGRLFALEIHDLNYMATKLNLASLPAGLEGKPKTCKERSASRRDSLVSCAAACTTMKLRRHHECRMESVGRVNTRFKRGQMWSSWTMSTQKSKIGRMAKSVKQSKGRCQP